MRRAIYFLFFILLLGCASPEVEVTGDYLYSERGVTNGFTVHLIEVTELNEQSYPKQYKETSERADLVATGLSPRLNKIYFFKKNEGYYWSYTGNVKHDVLPFEFKSGKWYLIWSKDFDNSLETSSVQFFIYRNDNGVVSVYKEDFGKL